VRSIHPLMRIELALVCALLGGCVTELEPELSTTDTNVEIPNRLAANRLAANRLAANHLAAGSLSASSADLAALTSDAGGIELLTYMMSCALPPGASLTVGSYVFPGEVGLAPKWLEKALKPEERRWVSACLLARVNLFGVSVMLSMRSASGALSTSKSERAGFTLVEGAFWGDVFTGAQPLVMNACRSTFKATDPQISTMPLRECTVPDGTGATRCGFAAKGDCEVACEEDKDGDRFSGCAGAAEVITVSLERP
jgi:hypothetical protein